jgi:RND family efflux transporter MFP subunit
VPSAIQKLLENPKLRRAAPWVAPLLVALVAFVLLGPGFARVRSAESEAPAPPAAPEAAFAPPPAVENPAPPSYAALPPDAATGPAEAEPVADFPREDRASTLDCIIEPSEVIEVRSPVRGRIEKLHVQRGDPVEADQVLVELESSVERAAVELAEARSSFQGEVQSREARLELGQRKQARAKQLYDGQALSVDQRDEAETEAKVARLELQQARENQELAALELARARALLERRMIRSPITGYVFDQLMSRGEVVDEETILRLAQIDPLKVEVILPSAMYGTIRPDMRAAVMPEVPGDQVHVASVETVDPVIDAASGTFGVLLELPNPDHAIPGGLRCQVRFLSE